jgi:predicted dehydrogenase
MNVALLGYGFAGKTLHAPLIRSVKGLDLIVVMSSRPDHVKGDLPGVGVVATPEEVFSDSAIDLLVIATPNVTHFDLTRRGLMAGKHVVVDKPFTTTVAEAAELVDLAGQSDRLLSVYQSRRWDGDFLTVRQLISHGQLGDVMHLASHYDRYRPRVQDRWRERAGPASGIWYDLGAHLVDQVLQLFGMPEAVFADLAMQRENAVAVDYFHVLLRYGRTRVVLHGSNLVAEAPLRFALHGTAGSFVKYGMDSQEEALKRGELPGTPGWGEDPQDGTLTTWAEGATAVGPVRSVAGNYPAYYEAIRDAIEKGGPNPVTPGQGLAVMTILELAVESSGARRELSCPAVKME